MPEEFRIVGILDIDGPVVYRNEPNEPRTRRSDRAGELTVQIVVSIIIWERPRVTGLDISISLDVIFWLTEKRDESQSCTNVRKLPVFQYAEWTKLVVTS